MLDLINSKDDLITKTNNNTLVSYILKSNKLVKLNFIEIQYTSRSKEVVRVDKTNIKKLFSIQIPRSIIINAMSYRLCDCCLQHNGCGLTDYTNMESDDSSDAIVYLCENCSDSSKCNLCGINYCGLPKTKEQKQLFNSYQCWENKHSCDCKKEKRLPYNGMFTETETQEKMRHNTKYLDILITF